MFTDKIMAVLHPVGHEHKSWHNPKIYLDPPRKTMETLNRAVETMDDPSWMSGSIPEIGEITDIPMLALSPTTIILVGKTWLATLEAYVMPENEASDAN